MSKLDNSIKLQYNLQLDIHFSIPFHWSEPQSPPQTELNFFSFQNISSDENCRITRYYSGNGICVSKIITMNTLEMRPSGRV